jgi:hypothetical protein
MFVDNDCNPVEGVNSAITYTLNTSVYEPESFKRGIKQLISQEWKPACLLTYGRLAGISSLYQNMNLI